MDLLGGLHRWELFGGFDVGDVVDFAFGEDKVDFFEGAAGCLKCGMLVHYYYSVRAQESRGGTNLGIEKVDEGEEEGVHDGKEKVGAPAGLAGAVDHDGGDHDDEEVPDPVGDGRYSVGLCSGLQWVDFCGVEPREWEPSGSKEGDVGEETDGCTLCGGLGAGDESAKGDNHGETLAGTAN